MLTTAEFAALEDADARRRAHEEAVAARRREHHELFLYQHLSEARLAREAMDRAPTFCDFAYFEHAHKQALGAATRHYRALLADGTAMDPVLAAMAMREQLIP